MKTIKKFILFLPPKLHRELKIWSATEEKSMNDIIVDILQKQLKGKFNK